MGRTELGAVTLGIAAAECGIALSRPGAYRAIESGPVKTWVRVGVFASRRLQEVASSYGGDPTEADWTAPPCKPEPRVNTSGRRRESDGLTG